MLLAVDIGNTNITIGVFENDKLKFVSRIFTDRQLTEDQCFVELNDSFKLYGIPLSCISDAVIGSVVPALTVSIKNAITRLFGVTPFIVTTRSFKGLPFSFSDSVTFGVDLLCGCAAAVSLYPSPCVVIDLGTANTISVIDKNNEFIGGCIFPGIRTSLDALVAKASMLSAISLDPPKTLISTDTAESMRSGMIFGTACTIDGMVQRINACLGYDCTVVLTGGFSSEIAPFCLSDINLNENLVLYGLQIVYNKNIKYNV